MEAHRLDLARTVRVLTYLIKHGKVDPDRKTELFYTCSMDRVTGIHSSKFERAVMDHHFSDGPCHISNRFDQIVSGIQNRRESSNGASIYVLTNARWDAKPNSPRNLCGVGDGVERLVNTIKQQNRESNYVGVQFIRFYDRRPNQEDEHGEARLKYLDDTLGDLLKRKHGVANGDIVDTTDWDGNVRKLMLGGIQRNIDGRAA